MLLARRPLLRALALLLVPGSARAQATRTTRVSFVLVNDIYLMNEERGADGKMRGGFARLAAVVKAERAKGGHVIFAHAGDTFSPSLMSGLDRGAHIVTLTNMIPPDVFAPGNHEFDFGKAAFFERLAESRFPYFAANLRGPDGSPLPGIKDRAILEFDGIRIGVTGVTWDETPRSSSSEDLRFLPTVATAKQQAEALRREGADFVLAVAHADRPQDIELLASRAVDLILSGHDHDLFVSFDGGNGVIESSYDAHYVTVIDAEIAVTERASGRRQMKWWPQIRIIDTATVMPDPEVAAVIAGFERELSREMDVALGTTAVELDSRNATVRTREAAIGNLIADAMRISGRADAAVMNGGGIRSGKVYAPGSAITRRDVLAELPFGNRMVIVEITGRGLRRSMENGISLLPDASGRFPQVSGLTLDADIRRPAGQRIAGIRMGGEPLDENRTYRVALNDFMARGGDNYTDFRDARRITPDNDAPLVANEVMVHVRRLGTVRTGVEGRIVLR